MKNGFRPPPGKEQLIRLTIPANYILHISFFSDFGFKGRILVLIVSVSSRGAT